MAFEITPAVQERLAKEQIIWITSVNLEGQPQPTPVWFLWDNGQILIMSGEGAKKVRNLRANSHVALNFNTDAYGGAVVVITGKAQVETGTVPPDVLAKYFAKYGEGIKQLGMTNEVMAQQFSAHIYVTPDRIRAGE